MLDLLFPRFRTMMVPDRLLLLMSKEGVVDVKVDVRGQNEVPHRPGGNPGTHGYFSVNHNALHEGVMCCKIGHVTLKRRNPQTLVRVWFFLVNLIA